MVSELINTLIKAVADRSVTLFLDKRKALYEDKKEKQNEEKKIYEERPELEIIKYKEYLNRSGHKLKKECDIDVFITKMEKVSVEDNIIIAHYNKDFFNDKEWCCVIYSFKNVGKTDIRCVSPICTYKKNTLLCSVSSAQMIMEHGLLSYSTTYDRKIRVGESFTMRICYHKDCIFTDMISPIIVMGIEDCNDRFWAQPLFAPNNKIYETYRITHKEYHDDILPETAIECFKKPWLW